MRSGYQGINSIMAGFHSPPIMAVPTPGVFGECRSRCYLREAVRPGRKAVGTAPSYSAALEWAAKGFCSG
jgi:hypothetical protein